MNVVDSSGWLEYFANGRNANFFASPIEDTAQLVVPTIIVYEIFKRILQQRNEDDAIQSIAAVTHGILVDLTTALALSAARVSVEYRLPMADSIILATAREHGAILWTQDADFRDIDGVRYIEK